ncbi:MAG: RIP metalloprotease RseP [Candidatus Omnitrophica bacterium]|nr:RIP metalloprotease RseP [Candidatus Omnitrophota bacterium]
MIGLFSFLYSVFVFLVILGIAVLAHEFGHYLMARNLGIRIKEFFVGVGGRKIFSRKKDDTEYGIKTVLLGGYIKLAGDSLDEYTGKPDEYLAQPPGKRFLVIFFGPLFNYILGILCFWMIFFVGYPTVTTKIGGVIDGFGAKDVGLMAGDRIISVDGKKVRFFEDLQRIVQFKKEPSVVKLSVLRGDKEFGVSVPIKEKKYKDTFGQRRSIGLLGIFPGDEVVIMRYGFLESFKHSIERAWNLTVLTYKSVFYMVMGKLSIKDSAAGPLGLYFITAKIAVEGVMPLINLFAVLSINLCICNLLPLPVLDGGHIMFLVLEKIRGKALKKKTEEFINKAGLAFIIFLFVIFTYNDVMRIYGDKIYRFLLR